MSKPVGPTAPEQAEQVTPDAIMQLGLGFWGSKTLLSAVELGLFAVISKTGPLDAEELRERLGLHPRGARDFFDALVALGMLARDDARYSNTAATELFLDPAKPSYIGGLLEMANARSYAFWGSLTEALRTGECSATGAPLASSPATASWRCSAHQSRWRITHFAHA